ncbi:hypothetical protein, partial [Deinococcus caeni]
CGDFSLEASHLGSKSFAVGTGLLRDAPTLPVSASQVPLLSSYPLERAIERALQEISLLREYRTRLIADVVTGKLDVRAAAARLPDLTDEVLPDELDADLDGDEAEGDETEAEGAEA